MCFKSSTVLCLAFLGALAGCVKYELTVNAPLTDFGYVWIGQSTLRGVAWTNHTNGKVDVEMMQKLNPPFGFKPLTGSTAALPPGGIYGVEILASPDQVGEQTEDLVVNNAQNWRVEPTQLKVIGLGHMEKGCLTMGGGYINALSPAPAGAGGTGPTGSPNNGPMDFGTILVGGHSEKTITLNNSSAADVTAVVQVVSRAVNAFTATLSTGGAALKKITVPAKGSLTIIVGFKPPFAGKFVSILQVYDGANLDASANADALVLTGIGRAGE